VIEPLPRGDAPFDTTGIVRDERGIAHYTDMPVSLVEMFRCSVDRAPNAEAVVEEGRPAPRRVSFQELWDRAARVAGGLADEDVRPGDRVAILLPSGVDWVVGFLGIQLAGAVAVPVNVRFAEPEIAYVLRDSGSTAVLRPGRSLPDGAPRVVAATTVVLPAFTAGEFLGSIVEERISFLAGVPAIYALSLAHPDFADYDVKGVTRLTYGGAPVVPELVHRIAAAFPNARLGNGFGLTESAAISTFLPYEWAGARTRRQAGPARRAGLPERPAGRFQDPAVRRGPRGNAAAQPGRQDPQTAAAGAHQMGCPICADASGRRRCWGQPATPTADHATPVISNGGGGSCAAQRARNAACRASSSPAM